MPHFSRQEFANLGNKLLKAHDHDLDYSTALRLRDEQDEDVRIRWHDEAKLVQITDKEVVETLNDGLDGLQIESTLFVVVAPRGSLDSKIDVLEHREQNLTQDLPPELQAEYFYSLLEDLE